MTQRVRAAMLVTVGSLVLFATAAALPIWTRSHRGSRGEGAMAMPFITYHPGPLWKADFVQPSWIRDQNRIQAAVIATVLIFAGLFVHRRLVPKSRPEPVGDYEEKADGSIPDGRAPPG